MVWTKLRVLGTGGEISGPNIVLGVMPTVTEEGWIETPPGSGNYVWGVVGLLPPVGLDGPAGDAGL